MDVSADAKVFALVEKSVFKEELPDFENTIDVIRRNNDFKSLQEIIEDETVENFSGKARTFKILRPPR